jgi:acetyl-CoA carboxylase biotin carboxylase subunit
LFRRLLIANRGEIAVRIARACREAGIVSVAVHSQVETSPLHARVAEEAVALPGSTPAETYLNIPLLLDAARRTGCEAIHPGYGFLSENAGFAEAVRSAGLVFVGPEAETIRQLGDKTQARRLVEKAGVAVVPGFQGGKNAGEFRKAAKKLGFPVLVKAAGGGGGRGMRVASGAEELEEALESASREAQGAFGDSRVFVEKFIPSARHVEVQILGDSHGRVISLFERDCSIQRRHQKILEESPSPAVEANLREKMSAAAIAAAKAASYSNAGTVEFLLDPESGEFYFLEVNTRLQVEHPVTEMLTGVDLVLAQLRLAAGEPISPLWSEATSRGHVIECRLCAEDPAQDFAPSPGRVLQWKAPEGTGIRVDTGYEKGDEVSIHYDSLLAKILVVAEDRAAAIRRMRRALRETCVLGPVTNLELLGRILANPVFQRGEAATNFLSRSLPGSEAPLPDEILIAAAVISSSGQDPRLPGSAGEEEPEGPWDLGDGFRLGG